MKAPWWMRGAQRKMIGGRPHMTFRPHTAWIVWRLFIVWLDWRSFRWYRRAVGGELVLLWTSAIPGGQERWHRHGVDPEPAMSSWVVVAREAFQ